MNSITIKNLQPIAVEDIPLLSIDELGKTLREEVTSGRRVVQFFGDSLRDRIKLYVILADDAASTLSIMSTEFTPNSSYTALTPQMPAFHMFEREFYEQYGIMPDGHPWLKPVRHGIAGISADETPYSFFDMMGDQIHQVGVGPIHAGVIEPGHFRFACFGEDVHHLEIQLGFQHRGVEELFLQHQHQPYYLLHLAESIVGDTVIGHTTAYIAAVEALGGISITRRAQLIRTLMLELERIGNHLGDLSALANDVAYLTGNAVFGAMRTRVINTSLAICGSRFGRGMIGYGGVNFDLDDRLIGEIKTTLQQIEQNVDLASEVFFSSPSVLARFEKTGIVTHQTAQTIGLVGPSARASGVSLDVRADFPSGGYRFFPVHKITLPNGDVFARAYLRYIEIKQSLRIIQEQIDTLPSGELNTPLPIAAPRQLVVSMCEGWRGEIVHTAIVDASGKLCRYKIKDPSFNNWFALALAVRNNGISDFPLCNKSYNLSYCGFDL